MVDVGKQLELSRKNLLDLTLKNRLLNYRYTKAQSLKLLNTNKLTIFKTLVEKDTPMRFRSIRINDSAEGVSSEVSEDFLLSNLDAEELYLRLKFILQKSNLYLEEQGYSVLFLALGFLKWRESDNSEDALAPIVLVPVDLEPYRVSHLFKIRWNGGDITPNISLKEKLLEQGVDFPSFDSLDDTSDLEKYYSSVIRAIRQKTGWEVVPDVCLGFFSFNKFAMYKDLNPTSWPSTNSPIDHPILNILYNNEQISGPAPVYDDVEIDEITSDDRVYHVMDADPSQIKVLEDVKRGHSIVVEGPPGTGKSQTIVNMIAELLAEGKTVLFVSEKMAALQVVKERLDGKGLGNYCLELHSKKANKKEVLAELNRSRSLGPPPAASENFEQLRYLKDDLNSYAHTLGTPYGKLNITPFQLFCGMEKIIKHFSGREIPRFSIGSAESIDKTQFVASIEVLRSLDPHLAYIGTACDHPWYGCKPGIVLPGDQKDISSMVSNSQDVMEKLRKDLDAFVAVTGISPPVNEASVASAIEAGLIMADSKKEYADILLNQEWNGPNAAADEIINHIELYGKKRASILTRMSDNALGLDASTLLPEYKRLSSGIWKYIRPGYYRQRKSLLSHYKIKPENDDAIISDLTALTEYRAYLDWIISKDELGKSLFGGIWAGETSDSAELRSMSVWMISFRKKLIEGIFTDGTVERMVENFSSQKALDISSTLATSINEFITSRKALFSRINIDSLGAFGADESHIPFEGLRHKLELWANNIEKLQRWSQYVVLKEQCRMTAANSMLPLIESGGVKPGDLVPCFEGNLYESLLRQIYQQQSVIASFNGDIQEGKIARYADLDRAIIENNCNRLSSLLYERVPRVFTGCLPGSQEFILNREFQRLRRFMPIRKLLLQCGGVIQRIKPCFMMSPLSIALFLDPESISFDVVIFDEASQVKPEDALGAILRGQQLVVLGDSRQLPPTGFFDRMIESGHDDDDLEEDDANAGMEDMESILHMCKRVLNYRELTWHYRSKHESLIAVSNREFYNNAMRIYPSSIDRSEDLGLQFVYIQKAVYERGNGARNLTEAGKVAQAVLDHFRKHPDKSLGVGTFSMSQKVAIEDEIDRLRCNNKDLDEHFKADTHEHFFVKNLETIQGDERDVIFISVGYGPDESGRFYKNFGPLGHDGGERRLNVLITRAREKCVVFSSFRSIDLSAQGNSPFGVRALKTFLEYAENRTFPLSSESSGDFDSPFEESVYNFLRDNGYEVRKQVGCAGFRIDLAIVDPTSPGRYLVGVECDGAPYHSCAIARDRDRLREQILKKLGWRIVRVWSTDWYHNNAEAQRKLLNNINLPKPVVIDDTKAIKNTL